MSAPFYALSYVVWDRPLKLNITFFDDEFLMFSVAEMIKTPLLILEAMISIKF